MEKRPVFFAVLVLAISIAAVYLITPLSVAQVPQPIDGFRGMIEDLRRRQVPFTVEFAASLSTGERSRTFSNDLLRLGDDYFCFGEPWNQQYRYHCTPFANVISVTFIDE